MLLERLLAGGFRRGPEAALGRLRRRAEELHRRGPGGP